MIRNADHFYLSFFVPAIVSLRLKEQVKRRVAACTSSVRRWQPLNVLLPEVLHLRVSEGHQPERPISQLSRRPFDLSFCIHDGQAYAFRLCKVFV